jgi:Putative polyhydroxyalkanoic acid system protein (PHA_gran_rgn)
MAKLNLALDHGQTLAEARANFERAISAAQDRFGAWIQRADWSEDRSSVRMTGPGFDVELSYDAQKVYARGTVPLAFKLMEGSIKSFIRQALAQES